MAVVTRYHHQIHVCRLTVIDENWGWRKERKRGVEWTGRCHLLPSLDMSTCHFSFSFASNTICLSISQCLWLSEGGLCLLRGNSCLLFENRRRVREHLRFVKQSCHSGLARFVFYFLSKWCLALFPAINSAGARIESMSAKLQFAVVVLAWY